MNEAKSSPRSKHDLITAIEYSDQNGYRDVRYEDDQEFYDAYLLLVSERIRNQILLHSIDKHLDILGFSLIRNNFPYTKLLENLPSVHHYVLWFVHRKTREQIEEYLATQKWSWHYWHINKSEHQSVKEFSHAHVFIEF